MQKTLSKTKYYTYAAFVISAEELPEVRDFLEHYKEEVLLRLKDFYIHAENKVVIKHFLNSKARDMAYTHAQNLYKKKISVEEFSGQYRTSTVYAKIQDTEEPNIKQVNINLPIFKEEHLPATRKVVARAVDYSDVRIVADFSHIPSGLNLLSKVKLTYDGSNIIGYVVGWFSPKSQD